MRGNKNVNVRLGYFFGRSSPIFSNSERNHLGRFDQDRLPEPLFEIWSVLRKIEQLINLLRLLGWSLIVACGETIQWSEREEHGIVRKILLLCRWRRRVSLKYSIFQTCNFSSHFCHHLVFASLVSSNHTCILQSQGRLDRICNQTRACARSILLFEGKWCLADTVTDTLSLTCISFRNYCGMGRSFQEELSGGLLNSFGREVLFVFRAKCERVFL